MLRSGRNGLQGTSSLVVFLGLMLLAANLRAPFTNVGPIQDLIQTSYGLSATSIGLLTTLPLAAFAVVSPFAAIVSRRLGIELSLVVALSILIFGIAVRSYTSVVGLYLGTALIGLGIAIGNVLLPSVIKRDYPLGIPNVTGLSTVTMGIFAAIFSMAVVPLASVAGWRMALSMNMVLPMMALLIWGQRLRAQAAPFVEVKQVKKQTTSIWRVPLAWYITLFMGLNSFLYYIFISWLPSMLTSSGYTPAEAGTLHGVMQLATAIPGLFLGPIISRIKDLRLLAVGTASLMTVAILGLMGLPQYAVVWVFCFGWGSCSIIILSFVFMGSRSHTSHQTTALSGMAQSVGYMLAAVGPFIAGFMHQQFYRWTELMIICVLISITMMVFAVKAAHPHITMPKEA